MTRTAETADQQRIRQLEAEVAALKAGGARPPQPPVAPVEKLGVRVTYVRKYSIEMPTTDQYHQLIGIVARTMRLVPDFDGKNIDPAFYAGFVGSFERITSLRRTAELNVKRPARDWADEAYNWLHERGDRCDTTNGSFFAAVVAAGDINYSLSQPSMGVPARVGLSYGPDGRSASTEGWRGVLARGAPRPPTNPVTASDAIDQNPRPTQRFY